MTTNARLPRALFVCIHNAGRSQMALALWERRGGEGRAAGSDPAATVNPVVTAAMAELGIDISSRVPRRLDDGDGRWAEVVVTMGCGDACPYIPGVRYVDWDLPDPSGRDLAMVRGVRDEIARRVEELASPAV